MTETEEARVPSIPEVHEIWGGKVSNHMLWTSCHMCAALGRSRSRHQASSNEHTHAAALVSGCLRQQMVLCLIVYAVPFGRGPKECTA